MRTPSNGLYIVLIIWFIIFSFLNFFALKVHFDKVDYETNHITEELKTEIKILKQEIRYLEEHVDCLHRDDKRFPCVVGDSHE